MLDADLIANLIGIVRSRNTVTILEVSCELKITQVKALEMLEQLKECGLIVKFDGFYACTDLCELN